MMTCSELPPFRENDWSLPNVIVLEGEDDTLYVSSPYPPLVTKNNLITVLEETAAAFPNRNFLARRNKENNEWNFITYQQIDQQSSSIAQWLLNLNLVDKRPVMILSENSFEHAAFMLGALKAGFPVAPTSPNYCLLSDDYNKIKKIYTLLEPSVIFAQESSLYEKAIASFDSSQVNVVYVESDPASRLSTRYQQIIETSQTVDVRHSINAIQPEDVAKILFTSGSTGEPKGVVNSHKNLVSTLSALGSIVRIDPVSNPPIMLDWMPWHHTYAGNQNFNRVMYYGGTMYLDEGKPLPHLFEKTVQNLCDVPISVYTTVPAVYALLINIMKTNQALRKNFFKHLMWLSYGGADMPQSTFDEIQKLAIAETGQRISIITGFGSTESSALITTLHWPNEQMGNIGLPIPATTIKLCPIDDKYEMRVKGPQITPGYFRNETQNEQSFDEEGFFKTGDAVRWKDKNYFRQGMLFAGRVCEDFKLLNGSWVHTGAIRTNVLSSLSPLIDDLVITGQDKSYICLLLWINEAALRKNHNDTQTPYEKLIFSDEFKQQLQNRFKQYNLKNKSSTLRISKVLNMSTPPSFDDGEVSDKRSINQRAVLENRSCLVERLYADKIDPQVIVIAL
ncbi:MAG: AMP-binding protein [Kangiellaceae bacterium]|nr:AMP-binding protein [Kangiellaceae bacterium]